MTKKVLSCILSWMGLNVTVQNDVVSNFLSFGAKIQGKRIRGIRHLVWIAVVRKVWFARNKVLFKGEVVSVKLIVNAVMYTVLGLVYS